MVDLQLLMRDSSDEGDEVELHAKCDDEWKASNCMRRQSAILLCGTAGQDLRAMKPLRIANGGLPTFHRER
jgi:hypothetical protein